MNINKKMATVFLIGLLITLNLHADPIKYLLKHGFFETTFQYDYDNAKKQQYGEHIYRFVYEQKTDDLNYQYVFYEPKNGDTNEYVQVNFKDDSGKIRYFIKVNRGEKGTEKIQMNGNVARIDNPVFYLWK